MIPSDFSSLMAAFEKMVRRGGSGSDYLVQMARNFLRGPHIAVRLGDLERLSIDNRELLWGFLNVYSMPDKCQDRLAQFAHELDDIAKERGLDEQMARFL